jgi:hypothetical protein
MILLITFDEIWLNNDLLLSSPHITHLFHITMMSKCDEQMRW